MNIFYLIGGTAFLVSMVAFLSLYERARGKVVRFFFKAAPIGWGMYLVWEMFAASIGWGIRIDLLLIYPLLIVISVGALISWIVAFFQNIRVERPK